ncbi:MAG: cell division protein ZapA [Chitinispirillales bacterium]|jgi:cell division protein ZapA|nr:cell division protein ZapA [Chitinispirillales bacterium]
MSSESIRVVIFGIEYSIKGDADTETTKQVAQYVNSKIAEIQEVTASRDNMKIAVLSALNIAGELFETKAKYEEELKRVQQYQEKIKSLNSKIESFS